MALLVLGFSWVHRAPPDEVRVALLRGMAEQGNPGAQLQLALALQEGRYGLLPDHVAADRWFERAARNGNGYAADRLASALLDGDGVARDPAAAERWWRRAAAAGHTDAEWRLGRLLLAGDGVPADPAAGERWLRRAASHGSAAAGELLAEIATPGRAPAPPQPDRLSMLARMSGSPVLAAIADFDAARARPADGG